MELNEEIKRMKLAAPELAASSHESRNEALYAMKTALLANKEAIFAANEADKAAAQANHIAAPVLKRLNFDEEKLNSVIAGIQSLTTLPDPISQTQFIRELDKDLVLRRVTCPIGVIGVIFEARPDALVQILSLCIKSGNCVVLKGGSEAMKTNKTLFDILHQAILSAGLPTHCMMQLKARAEITELLSCHDCVDLLIPRGSNAFVQYIMNNTKIPVMGHADGICHIYVDANADLEKAVPIIMDAKTQYVSACNTVETLLVHQDIAENFLPTLKTALDEKKVAIRGTKEVADIIPCEPATTEDDTTEYLDYVLSIKIVHSIEEAIAHINLYGSHHTDCILTQDPQAAETFFSLVDSASVYQNCSTRFADGYRYGFGAEVGISTGKLHARGPVGVEGLLSYKYRLVGNGQIVGDYASGKKAFQFKDIYKNQQ